MGKCRDTKVCPAPGCGHAFQGNGWGGIDAHWKAKHEDICPYDVFREMLQNIETSAQPMGKRRGTKVCPAPGCGHVFQGNGWDGIDAHWKAKHAKDICRYDVFWEMLQNIEASAQPARQRAIVVHKCEQCGKKFSGVQQARFCSDKCRYDAANRRRRGG